MDYYIAKLINGDRVSYLGQNIMGKEGELHFGSFEHVITFSTEDSAISEVNRIAKNTRISGTVEIVFMKSETVNTINF